MFKTIKSEAIKIATVALLTAAPIALVGTTAIAAPNDAGGDLTWSASPDNGGGCIGSPGSTNFTPCNNSN